MYEADPSDPTETDVKNLMPLTKTELPNIPGNNISQGLAPNTENSNPFFLSNGDRGTYNFLLDSTKGQLDTGRTYIFIINPPPDSIYQQRRFRLVIEGRNGDIVSYTATSLDGKPLNTTDNRTSENGILNIQDAANLGLVFAVLDLNTSICQVKEVQIVKTGDRAAAHPGDPVIYRFSVRNIASSSLNNVFVTDTLPLECNFLLKSVRAELGNTPVQITTIYDESRELKHKA